MNYSTIVENLSQNASLFEKKYSVDPNFIQRYRVWTNMIDNYSVNVTSAYDMGCGTGIFSFYLAAKGINTIGYDGADGMIEICNHAKEKNHTLNIEFKLANLPMSEYSAIPKVDLIISSSVIEYITDVDSTIRMFHELIKDQGKLIVSFPNKASFYRKIEKVAFKIMKKPGYFRFVKNVWTKSEAAVLFEKYGFKNIESAYYSNRSVFSKIIRFIAGDKFAGNLIIMVLEKRK